MNPITKEEWVAWRSLKVTQEFLSRLNENREGLKEGLAEGQASNDKELYITIGQCQGLLDAIRYGVRDFIVIDPSQEDMND